MSPDQTPADVAKNEAARQAVVLLFGVVTLLIAIPLQRRLLERLTETMNSDPSDRALRRMERAVNAERRWNRVADYLFDVRIFEGARRAWAQARRARADYEDARGA